MIEYMIEIKKLKHKLWEELHEAWEIEAIAGTFEDEWYQDKKAKGELLSQLQEIVDDYEYLQEQKNNY